MNRILLNELTVLETAVAVDLGAVQQVLKAEEVVAALWLALGLELPKSAAWHKPDETEVRANFRLRERQLLAVMALGQGSTGLYGVVWEGLHLDAMRLACLMAYESVNEAQTVQQWLFELAKQSEDYQRTRQWLTLLRTAIEQQEETLPYVEYHTLHGVKPALVLAYELYDDLAWEADLVRRNAIRHPGFIMAGRVLEVLSRVDR